MKYKEFERKLKLLAFNAKRDSRKICIYTLLGELVAVVYNDDQGDVYFLDRCANINPEERMKLYDLVLEYAKTPVSERAEEKKYNVVSCRHKYGTPDNMTEETYFYYRGENGYLFATDGKFNHEEKQQWSMKQIEEYGLEDCERIEVTNDEK